MSDQQAIVIAELLNGVQLSVAHVINHLHQEQVLDQAVVIQGLRNTATANGGTAGMMVSRLADILERSRRMTQDDLDAADSSSTEGKQDMRDILQVIEGGLSSRPASDQEDPDGPPSPEPPDKGA